MKAWPRLSRLSGMGRAVVLAALLGGTAAALQSGVRADENCPTEYGSCTTSCFWQGGCGCTTVGCKNGECKYTKCSTNCCTSCGGPACETLDN